MRSCRLLRSKLARRSRTCISWITREDRTRTLRLRVCLLLRQLHPIAIRDMLDLRSNPRAAYSPALQKPQVLTSTRHICRPNTSTPISSSSLLPHEAKSPLDQELVDIQANAAPIRNNRASPPSSRSNGAHYPLQENGGQKHVVHAITVPSISPSRIRKFHRLLQAPHFGGENEASIWKSKNYESNGRLQPGDEGGHDIGGANKRRRDA
jgi:hypothetical protein